MVIAADRGITIAMLHYDEFRKVAKYPRAVDLHPIPAASTIRLGRFAASLMASHATRG